jgi:hypothetical protein
MFFGPIAWYGQLHEFAKCCNGNLTNYQVRPTTAQLHNLVRTLNHHLKNSHKLCLQCIETHGMKSHSTVGCWSFG